MNKSAHRLARFLSLAVIAALFPAASQGAGLIGHRYVSASYEWTKVESAAFDHGAGFNAVLNQPVSDDLDLTASFVHAKKNSARPTTADANDDEFFLAGTFLGSSEDGIPYLRLGLGWAQTKSGGAKNDAFMHSIEIGAELSAGRDGSVAPFVNWRDSFDGKVDGALSYGLRGEISCGRSCSVLATIVGDDHFNWTGGVGFALRF